MSIAEKLQTIAENEQRVYDAGKQAEHKAFWDGYLDNGNLRYCVYLFSGRGWNDNTFRPNHDIIAWGDVSSMFNNCGTLDLKQRLIDCGKKLNVGSASTNSLAFAYSGLTSVPRCNWASASVLDRTYRDSTKLVEIELVVHENLKYTNTFNGCTALVTLIVSGTLGQNGFDVHWSTKLSKESQTNIINVLSSTTSGLTVTMSQEAKEAAFTADEWATLIATKPNWTIALA
jgi:hypothetical protein